eukprot:Pompholyxophrys_sp_v1_NODE_300_length_813_cov_1.693931.p3 type:complete len:110 gc:universal NODE_300_length_813_cov_1.693931:650-321(-)
MLCRQHHLMPTSKFEQLTDVVILISQFYSLFNYVNHAGVLWAVPGSGKNVKHFSIRAIFEHSGRIKPFHCQCCMHSLDATLYLLFMARAKRHFGRLGKLLHKSPPLLCS